MEKFYLNYNPVKWDKTIEYVCKKTRKQSVLEVDTLPITKAEIDAIQNIKSRTLQRLLFTLLAIAKYGNLVHPQNSGWVNREFKDIFSRAHLQKTKNEQALLVSELRDLDVVSFSKKVDNVNIQVKIINDDSPPAIYLDDFREIGYVYLRYLGEKFIQCKECGRLIRPNKNNSNLYCKEHKGYNPIQTKILTCVDCGKEFVVDGIIKNKTRCDECYEKYRKQIINENAKRYYHKMK